ncbi:glycosyltransferase family 2 protein [Sphingomonas sp.]
MTPLSAGTGVRHLPAPPHVPNEAAARGLQPEPGMTIFWNGDHAVGHVLHRPGGTIAIRWAERAAPPVRAPAGLAASIVICTRDRPDALAACLASLARQTLRPAEIVVVDNASRDARTREAALAAGVVYVREDRPGLDIARNTGWRRATGEFVAYTDDDVELHPRWLEAMTAAFDAPEIGAVTGLVLPAELVTEAQFVFEGDWSFGQGYDRRDFTPQQFVRHRGRSVFPAWTIGAGASMAFRRTVFDAVGGFDERLDVGQAGCSGDSEYWYRLLDAGIACRYEPAAIAFHHHRRDMAGLRHQLRHYMRGHTAALLVQHERTGRRANLWRALQWLPGWYARRLIRRPVRRDPFLWDEIRGWAGGILFYLRQPK